MARRKMTDVEEMPLVGGRVCLDFVNTTGDRWSEAPRERLHTYGDLLVWTQRVGLIKEVEARNLKAHAAEDRDAADAGLERALWVRETLYGILGPLADGESVGEPEVSTLNARLREAARRRKLRFGPEEIEWAWPRDDGDLTWFLSPVLHSAEELLTSGELDRVARCGADRCDWLFFDETRNRSRRWCNKRCGNRIRARRHYRRQKED